MRLNQGRVLKGIAQARLLAVEYHVTLSASRRQNAMSFIVDDCLLLDGSGFRDSTTIRGRISYHGS